MAIATLRKAAVFLTSLPEPQAAKLLAMLAPEQATVVSCEITAIGTIGPDEQEAVMCEFVAAAPVCDEDRPAKASPFEFLHGIDTVDLLTLLGDERPQMIALVLSQLPPEQAADAIAALSPEQQAAIISRIAKIDRPSDEIVAEVAEAIHRRIVGPVSVPISIGMSRVVKMFGAMRPATERKLLGGIAETDPDLLQAIRRAILGADVAACGEWTFTGAAC